MKSDLVASSQSRNSSTDTIDFILDAHFDSHTQPNIDILVNCWSENGSDTEGEQQAILFIHQAANYSKEDFAKLLQDAFEGKYEDLENEGLKESYQFLDTVSNQCTGNLAINNDPILTHCSGLSSLTATEIEHHVGEYFRGKIDSYLLENHSAIYERIQSAGVRNYSYSEIFTEAVSVANDTSQQLRAPSPSATTSSHSQLKSRSSSNDITTD